MFSGATPMVQDFRYPFFRSASLIVDVRTISLRSQFIFVKKKSRGFCRVIQECGFFVFVFP